MRLLNAKTLEFEEFVQYDNGKGTPSYVILSHRWEDGEVSYTDHLESLKHIRGLSDDAARHEYLRAKRKGYSKILSFCEAASNESFQYCWVDTCCINKVSSAELSESINSMFQWYSNSAVCYVYLSDIEGPEESPPEYFLNSKWWQRGWTLQELVAPEDIVFFNAHWTEIGSKYELGSRIQKSKRVNLDALRSRPLSQLSIQERMSWAANRETSRPEDRAYSLMGLFNVNMPLLYGEGGAKAFVRLQEEILKTSNDHTIFAWASRCSLNRPAELARRPRSIETSGALAESPDEFVDENVLDISGHMHDNVLNGMIEVVKNSLHLRLPLITGARRIRLGAPPSPQSRHLVIPVVEHIDFEEKTVVATNGQLPDSNKANLVRWSWVRKLRTPGEWSSRPVALVLLNCRIYNNYQLAIAVHDKGDGESGQVWERIHKPSLVALNKEHQSLSKICRVHISKHSNPKSAFTPLYGYELTVAIGSILRSGYSIGSSEGIIVNENLAAIVHEPISDVEIFRTPRVKREVRWSRRLLFTHQSGPAISFPQFSISYNMVGLNARRLTGEVRVDVPAQIASTGSVEGESCTSRMNLSKTRRLAVVLVEGCLGLEIKVRLGPRSRALVLNLRDLKGVSSSAGAALEHGTIEDNRMTDD